MLFLKQKNSYIDKKTNFPIFLSENCPFLFLNLFILKEFRVNEYTIA